jgi:hypothetical protein
MDHGQALNVAALNRLAMPNRAKRESEVDSHHASAHAPNPVAARQLIAEGYDSRAILVLRHAGSDEDCLRANLQTAASLTVEVTKHGPRFRLWKPMPALAAASRDYANRRRPPP